MPLAYRYRHRNPSQDRSCERPQCLLQRVAFDAGSAKLVLVPRRCRRPDMSRTFVGNGGPRQMPVEPSAIPVLSDRAARHAKRGGAIGGFTAISRNALCAEIKVHGNTAQMFEIAPRAFGTNSHRNGTCRCWFAVLGRYWVLAGEAAKKYISPPIRRRPSAPGGACRRLREGAFTISRDRACREIAEITGLDGRLS